MTANGALTLSRVPGTSPTAHVAIGDAANGDKVEFSDGVGDGRQTLYPATGSIGVRDVTVNFTRKRATNALTGAQQVSNPDTGPDGLTYTIRFKATSLAAGSALARLLDWTAEDNAPTTATRRGRISLDDKGAPAHNLQASADTGLKIYSLNYTYTPNNGEILGTLVLILDGNPADVGS